MLSLLLALSTLVAPAPVPAPAPLGQELDLDVVLRGLSPEERFARRVTPEHLVALKARPAVVYIETDTMVEQRDFWGRLISRRSMPYGSGSGAVIRPEGFIVTNYHVVANAQKITVHFDKSLDPKSYEAEVVSFEQEEDLALLKIRGPAGVEFPTVHLGTSSDLMIGERVIAIGNPYGHTHTVSVGIISGLHRDVTIQDQNQRTTLHFDDLIQTDASINIGNSGGPLLNINGELIGINNAVNARAENIGFAIPVDRVKTVLERQLVSPDRYRAWLGFHVSEDDELVVRQISRGGPAEAAGMRVGDRVVELDGQAVAQLGEYQLARIAISPERPVEVLVRRPGETFESLRMRPWDSADGLVWEHLGVRVDLAVTGRRSSLVVSEVAEDGPAHEIGLQPGDVLEMVRERREGRAPGERLERRHELALAVARVEPGTALETYIRRDGKGYAGLVVTR